MRRLLPDSAVPSRAWWLRTLLYNAILLGVVAVAIQLVPVPHDNPPVEREPNWSSPELHALVVRACYNCHSDETEWPWYSNIAPVSWVIWYDVVQGRKKLNFTAWDRHADDEYVDPQDPFPPKTLTERIQQEISSGAMPPGTYRLLNDHARLTDDEKEFLIEGLTQTVKQSQDPTPTP